MTRLLNLFFRYNQKKLDFHSTKNHHFPNGLRKVFFNQTIRNLTSASNRNADNDDDSPKLYENGRKFQIVTIDNFKPLFKTNLSLKPRIEQILNVYEMEKYTTQQVPTNLTIKDMSLLLRVYEDEKELQKTIKFFYTRECDKFKSKRKKFYKQQENREKKIEKYGDKVDEWSQGIFDSDGHLIYGLWHNSLVSRIKKQSVLDYRQNNLLRVASLFGQKLIIDLDYDRYMKPSEANLLGQQIGILYYENRINRNYPNELPYDIHFTNCHPDSLSMQAISKHIKKIDQLSHCFHKKSYLELPKLFPKEKLVYLSPHARDSLKQYDHDEIYILGGYNDRSSHMNVSHVKAKSEGIRCYRLPLDEHVLWKQGNKNLCLNQVALILHAVKATNDWRLAIQNFAPKRKVRSAEEQQLEEQIRIRAVAKRLKNIERSYRLR